MDSRFDRDVPPPWVVYPFTNDPSWSGWRQGGGEGWLSHEWAPFWMGLDEEARVAYLERWPPPDAWRTHLRIDAARSVEPRTVGDLRSREIVVGGLRLPVIECGREEATEAAVFVHDLIGSTSNWRALVAATGNWARALAFD